MRLITGLPVLAAWGLLAPASGRPLSANSTCAANIKTVTVTVIPLNTSVPATVTLETVVSSIVSTATVAATTVTISQPGICTLSNDHTTPLLPTGPGPVSASLPLVTSTALHETPTLTETSDPTVPSPTGKPHGIGWLTTTHVVTVPLGPSSSTVCTGTATVSLPLASSDPDPSTASVSHTVVTFTLPIGSTSTTKVTRTITLGIPGPRPYLSEGSSSETNPSATTSSVPMITASFTLTLKPTGHPSRPAKTVPIVSPAVPVSTTVPPIVSTPPPVTDPFDSPVSTITGGPRPIVFTLQIPGTTPEALPTYPDTVVVVPTASPRPGRPHPIVVTFHSVNAISSEPAPPPYPDTALPEPLVTTVTARPRPVVVTLHSVQAPSATRPSPYTDADRSGSSVFTATARPRPIVVTLQSHTKEPLETPSAAHTESVPPSLRPIVVTISLDTTPSENPSPYSAPTTIPSAAGTHTGRPRPIGPTRHPIGSASETPPVVTEGPASSGLTPELPETTSPASPLVVTFTLPTEEPTAPLVVTFTLPGPASSSPLGTATPHGYGSTSDISSLPETTTSDDAVHATASPPPSVIILTLHSGATTRIPPPSPSVSRPFIPSGTDAASAADRPGASSITSSAPPGPPAEVTKTIPHGGYGSPSSTDTFDAEGTVTPYHTPHVTAITLSLTEVVLTSTVPGGPGRPSSVITRTTWKPVPFALSLTRPGPTANSAEASWVTIWPPPSPPASSSPFESTNWPSSETSMPPASSTESSPSVITLTLPPRPPQTSARASTAPDSPGVTASIPTVPIPLSSEFTVVSIPTLPISTPSKSLPLSSLDSTWISSVTISRETPHGTAAASSSSCSTGTESESTEASASLTALPSSADTSLPDSAPSSTSLDAITSATFRSHAPTELTEISTIPASSDTAGKISGYAFTSLLTGSWGSIPASGLSSLTLPGYGTAATSGSAPFWNTSAAATSAGASSVLGSSPATTKAPGISSAPVITGVPSSLPVLSTSLSRDGPSPSVANGTSVLPLPGSTPALTSGAAPTIATSANVTAPVASSSIPGNSTPASVNASSPVTPPPIPGSSAPISSFNASLATSEVSTNVSRTTVVPSAASSALPFSTTLSVSVHTSSASSVNATASAPLAGQTSGAPNATSNGASSAPLNGNSTVTSRPSGTGFSSALSVNGTLSAAPFPAQTGTAASSPGNITTSLAAAGQTGAGVSGTRDGSASGSALPAQTGSPGSPTANGTVLSPVPATTSGPGQTGAFPTAPANATVIPSAAQGSNVTSAPSGTVAPSGLFNQTAAGGPGSSNTTDLAAPAQTAPAPLSLGNQTASSLPTQTGQGNATSSATTIASGGLPTPTNGTAVLTSPPAQTGAGNATALQGQTAPPTTASSSAANQTRTVLPTPTSGNQTQGGLNATSSRAGPGQTAPPASPTLGNSTAGGQTTSSAGNATVVPGTNQTAPATTSIEGGAQGAPLPTSTEGAAQGGPAPPSTVSRGTSSTMNSTWSSTSTGPTSSPTCGYPGDVGNFTLNFDDLPPQSVAPGADPDTLHAAPVVNPYHRFWFSRGYGFAPPPSSPYRPSSSKMMVQYDQAVFANGTVDGTAQIDLGPQRDNPCLHFNLLSFDLGCNSTQAACRFNITGLRNLGDPQLDVPVVSNVFNVSACPSQTNCSLSRVTVGSAYSNLTSINIQLTVGNSTTETWWGDDLQLGWTNNTCASANCRSRVRNAVKLARKPRGSLAAKG